MELEFEWDPEKERENLKKHGVSFKEAETVFGDPLAADVPDEEHSTAGEQRWTKIGRSASGKTLKVVYLERGERIRIISARKLEGAELRAYEEGE